MHNFIHFYLRELLPLQNLWPTYVLILILKKYTIKVCKIKNGKCMIVMFLVIKKMYLFSPGKEKCDSV